MRALLEAGGASVNTSRRRTEMAALFCSSGHAMAPRPHKIFETDLIIDMEPGSTWSHQWRDSRIECSSGLGCRLKYPRSESSQTTKSLTVLEIPVWAAYFRQPSHPTLTGTNRADDCDDQCLGLVRSLGLAESHSANLSRGGRPRLISHSRDIGSQIAV